MYDSLRGWRDFARECFCFGREAVNTSGQAVRGLVKSREIPSRLRRSWIPSRASRGSSMAAPPLARPLPNPASYAGYMYE